MENKNVPKRYMFVLQRCYGGQEALEFSSDGKIVSVPIKPFSDQSLNPQHKMKIKKNTLAFYDEITCRYPNFYSFVENRAKLNFLDYREVTSYIGYINNGYMQTLSLEFNDPTLSHIAQKVDGSTINKDDPTTLDVVASFIDLIENSGPDFVDELKRCYWLKDRNFNFQKSLIDSIDCYYCNKLIVEKNYEYNSVYNSEMAADLEAFRHDFLKKIESYRNFRELYRFRKRYLASKQYQSTTTPVAVQEERPKQKLKKHEVEGQLSILDLLKDK